MKAKTKKTLERTVIILLVLVFILGTILLYLPVGNQVAPQTSPSAPGGNVQPPAGGTTQTTIPGS